MEAVKAYKALEFDKILERLAGYTESEEVKERIRGLEPAKSIEDASKHQRETTETVTTILKLGSPPVSLSVQMCIRDRYIAMSGAASRRGAEELIAEGRVAVNGKTITEQGVKVEIGADKVALDGEILKVKNKKYYIMLNKPVGYVTTVSDQFDRPTVIDLVKTDLKDVRLFPVGRLDYETEGLLLLTNDGDFTYRVTHPKFLSLIHI